MITPYNIMRHELTGLNARVVEATHNGYGCEGVIVAETRNTIDIEHEGKIKRLPKDCIVLELDLPGKCVVRIDGKLLVARPEDRIKKKYRIKFA
jgi:ribonuclease P protein subunit POP4